MEKKAVWITIIVLFVLFILQIPFNFHNNAYYYATHIHHEKNQYPFVTLLDSNYLPQDYVPDYKVQSKDLRGGYQSSIQLSDGPGLIKLDGFSMTYYANATRKSYYLQDFYVISFSRYGIVDEETKTGTVPTKAKRVLYQNLGKIQSEIKNNSEKPLINIQWLWNIWFKVPNH